MTQMVNKTNHKSSININEKVFKDFQASHFSVTSVVGASSTYANACVGGIGEPMKRCSVDPLVDSADLEDQLCFCFLPLDIPTNSSLIR